MDPSYQDAMMKQANPPDYGMKLEAEPKLAVMDFVNIQADQLNTLEAELTVLREKLNPIRIIGPDKAMPAGNTPANNSTLGSVLKVHNCRISDLIEYVRDLVREVEL